LGNLVTESDVISTTSAWVLSSACWLVLNFFTSGGVQIVEGIQAVELANSVMDPQPLNLEPFKRMNRNWQT
jgi:hypothetical protein